MIFDWEECCAVRETRELQGETPLTLDGEGLWVGVLSSGRCLLQLRGAAAGSGASGDILLGCGGVARIYFLNDKETGELWVNEINTIPGSLAFYLWEAAGLPFAGLLDKMVELAFKRKREQDALTFTYETNILDGVSLGGAKGAKHGGKA